MKKMKIKKLMALQLTFITAVCMMACGSVDKKNNTQKTETELSDKEVIILHSDVTKDGIDDEIRVNIYAAQDINSVNEYGDIDTVEIFSGKTKEKIWGKRITPIHMEQGGIYIYNDGENDYILEMCLYMNQGKAVYKYSVLDLSEDGTVEEKYTEDIGFSINADERKEDDTDKIKTFEKNVNEYLNKSYVVLDTNYNGNAIYSTEDNKVELTYDATDILNDLS